MIRRPFGRRFLRRLARDRKGIAAVELGLIAVPFCLVMVGLTDLCYQMYIYSVLQGATNDAARAVTVESPNIGSTGTLEQRMRQQIQSRMGGLGVSGATFNVAASTYYRYSDMGQGERLTRDNNNNGRYDSGDCWLDTNPNNTYDASVSSRGGVGTADDIVQFTTTFQMGRLIPIGALWGAPNTYNMTVRATIKRQPFADRVPPAERC